MTDETKPNIPALRKAVEWVEQQAALPKEEREWEQIHWISRRSYCGTAYCVAGYVAIKLVGAKVDDAARDRRTNCHVSDIAAEYLGIRGVEDSLFCATNDAADIRRAAENLAGEPL